MKKKQTRIEKDIVLLNTVLRHLKKVGDDSDVDGLCMFSEALRKNEIITESEHSRFMEIIYNETYRSKYVSADRQDSLWFFPMYDIELRIEYLKKIIRDLQKEQSKSVSKKSGKKKLANKKKKDRLDIILKEEERRQSKTGRQVWNPIS